MRKKAAAGYLTLVAVILGICCCIIWYQQHTRAFDAERSAAKLLEAHGAILVRDSSQHVASVNLSPLQSRAELEAVLNVIADLQWLASFDASRTPLNDDDLKAIGQLSRLTSLALAETKITDADVKSLTGLSGLASLNLAQTQVTSAALSDLAQLRGLKILDLTGNKSIRRARSSR